MKEPDTERWRELAEQGSKEQNAEKLMQLTKRINEILEENESFKTRLSGGL